MIDLKPCPFCGSSDVSEFDLDEETTVISCNGCNAQGGYYLEDCTQPEEAAEFWNRRP